MRAVFRSREIVPVVFALAALLGFSGAAFAHASLIRSSPPDDAVVARAPTRFDLTFSEPVSPLVLKLARPNGRVVTLDRFTLQRDTLVIEPPADLGRGTHALSWRVVSADGHPVAGTVVFSIGAPSAGAIPDVEDAVDWPVRLAFWTAKLVLYAGLFFGVGGAFFASWIGGGGKRAAALICTAMPLGFLAAVLSVELCVNVGDGLAGN